MSGIQLVAKIVTYALAGTASLFVVMYAIISRRSWTRTEFGWQIMADRAALAVVFLMLTAANLWPWLALQIWYLWIYVGAFAVICLLLIWQITILWRLNHPKD